MNDEFCEWFAQVGNDWLRARHFGIQIRFGQAFSNDLAFDRPDLFSLIAGTDYDPYYQEAVSMEICEFLSDRWNY